MGNAYFCLVIHALPAGWRSESLQPPPSSPPVCLDHQYSTLHYISHIINSNLLCITYRIPASSQQLGPSAAANKLDVLFIDCHPSVSQTLPACCKHMICPSCVLQCVIHQSLFDLTGSTYAHLQHEQPCSRDTGSLRHQRAGCCFRRLAVVTSDFHMPRTEAIFRHCAKLASSGRDRKDR